MFLLQCLSSPVSWKASEDFPFLGVSSIIVVIRELFFIRSPIHNFFLNFSVFHINFWIFAVVKISLFFYFVQMKFLTIFSKTILQSFNFDLLGLQYSSSFCSINKLRIYTKHLISVFSASAFTGFMIKIFLFFIEDPRYCVCVAFSVAYDFTS